MIYVRKVDLHKKRKNTEEGISKNRTKSTLDLEQTEKYECGEHSNSEASLSR